MHKSSGDEVQAVFLEREEEVFFFSFESKLMRLPLFTKPYLSVGRLCALPIQHPHSSRDSDPQCHVHVLYRLQEKKLMHEMRTDSTPFSFISLKEKKSNENQIECDDQFLLESSNTPASRTLTFQRPSRKHNNNANLWKCRLRVRGMRICCLRIFR